MSKSVDNLSESDILLYIEGQHFLRKGVIDDMAITINERHRIGNKINIYKVLKDSIQFLELKPGVRINEVEIASELGVSRTPVREALIRLSDENLVEIYPQRGTYVCKIDFSLAKEMAYMRHILETEVCMNLCREKAKIRDLVDQPLYFMNQALKKNDPIEYILHDDEFHRALFSYNNHEMIWNIISSTRAHYIRVLVLDMMFPHSLEDSYEGHMKILESIENGDEIALMEVLDVHHDHKKTKREEEIQEAYSDYFL